MHEDWDTLIEQSQQYWQFVCQSSPNLCLPFMISSWSSCTCKNNTCTRCCRDSLSANDVFALAHSNLFSFYKFFLLYWQFLFQGYYLILSWLQLQFVFANSAFCRLRTFSKHFFSKEKLFPHCKRLVTFLMNLILRLILKLHFLELETLWTTLLDWNS